MSRGLRGWLMARVGGPRGLRPLLLAGALLTAALWATIGRLPPGALRWPELLGDAALAVLLAGPVLTYLAVHRPPMPYPPRRIYVIVGLLALAAFSGRVWFGLAGPFAALFPAPAAMLLIALISSDSLALLAAAVLCVTLGLSSSAPAGVILTLLLGSCAGIFAIGRPSRGLTFFWAGGCVMAVVAAAQLTLLPRAGTLTVWAALGALLTGLGSGLLTAIVAFGLYGVIAQLAGFVTPFRLMELSHPSRPLLRRLMREAPGTYYHSIAVGNLAESAAEAVGADALLLRVAAYYHDVGKLIRPYFFTDNQSDRENVHNDLDPLTSAQIIADHVREGVKLARAGGLPPDLVDFIATHHGTQVIRQFYQLAIQQSDTVDIAAFRYPGPRPQTREQGILMLADSVEATVRSKAQHGQIAFPRDNGNGNGRTGPTRQTLEQLVGSIIEERWRSTQLDESQLLLRDLVMIQQAFVNTLQGIYHPRVEYAPKLGERVSEPSKPIDGREA